VFERGYHGGTLGFASKDNPMNSPYDFIIADYNNVEATRAVLDAEIGVILVEPLQSAGGGRMASKEFLQFLRKTADELQAVLIFDEVVTSRLDYHGIQASQQRSQTRFEADWYPGQLLGDSMLDNDRKVYWWRIAIRSFRGPSRHHGTV
jgi:hypothetical protein